MLEVGKKIGSYVLVRKLGAGGFGEVWQAEKHTKLSVNNFALKFFRPKEEDKLTLEKEKREIGIWQKVSGMPNIISIIEADEFEEYIYVVSEFADGGSLEKQMLANSGRAFPIEQTVTTVLEILSGLNSLHQMSFVHRDIKPANILIRRGVHCLADFGISREMKAHSKSTQTAGTYEYMSPESFENKPVTIHSDIWAVGVIMQQLLTGSLPFPQKEIPSLIYSILNREPEEMPQNVPLGLREIVKKSMEKDPQKRFNSAAEMISALKYQQMLLNKPEWGKTSQETLVWDANSKTEKVNAAHVVSPSEVTTRMTGEPAPVQNTNNLSISMPAAGKTKKSSRKALTFALLGGGSLLVLLLAIAAAAFVYKNTDLFTKNTSKSDQIADTNSNTNSSETNKNTEQKAQTGLEIESPQKTESSAAQGSSGDEVKESSTTPVPIPKQTTEVVKRKETVPPVTAKPTPVVKQQNTPKDNKKNNSDCIFTGDC